MEWSKERIERNEQRYESERQKRNEREAIRRRQQKDAMARRERERYRKSTSQDGQIPKYMQEDIAEFHKRRCIPLSGDWEKDAETAGISYSGGKYQRRYVADGTTTTSICADCQEYHCQWLFDDVPMDGWTATESKIWEHGYQVMGCPCYCDVIFEGRHEPDESYYKD